MATDGALKAFDRYFAFYQLIKVTPFLWNKKQNKVRANPDKLAWAHLYCTWCFGWAVCIYGTLRLLKEMYIRDENFKAQEITMYIFYNLIILISCILNAIYIFKLNSVMHVINTGISWDRLYRETHCWMGKKKKTKETFVERALINLVPGTFFGSVCGGLISFAFPIDPLQRFVVDHFPEIYIEYQFYVKVLSFFVIVICGCYIWGPVILAIIGGLVYTTGVKFWLTVLTGTNETEDGRLAQRSFRNQPFSQLMLFKSGLIMNTCTMEVAYYIAPFLIGIGSIITIFCNFATVKMYDIIPMPGYFLMPFVSILCHCAFSSFLHRAADFYVQSASFLLRKRNAEDPYFRRVAKGCRPIAFDVGPFFTCHRGSTLAVNGFITDFSIDLIMSVDLN